MNALLPVVINDIMHELYGEPGAFCGPTINHTVRQLRRRVCELEALLAHNGCENGAECAEVDDLRAALAEIAEATEGVDGLEYVHTISIKGLK